MKAVQESEIEAWERARARIRQVGKPVLSLEELYGPGPGPDDPEDLEAFLAFLAEQRRPVQIPVKTNLPHTGMESNEEYQ